MRRRALQVATGTLGLPPWPFVGFTVLEIVGAPLFIAWQARVAAVARAAPPG